MNFVITLRGLQLHRPGNTPASSRPRPLLETLPAHHRPPHPLIYRHLKCLQPYGHHPCPPLSLRRLLPAVLLWYPWQAALLRISLIWLLAHLNGTSYATPSPALSGLYNRDHAGYCYCARAPMTGLTVSINCWSMQVSHRRIMISQTARTLTLLITLSAIHLLPELRRGNSSPLSPPLIAPRIQNCIVYQVRLHYGKQWGRVAMVNPISNRSNRNEFGEKI